jgi:hypothetical protein
MKLTNLSTGLGCLFLILSLITPIGAGASEDLFKSDDEEMKQALEEVKTELIQKLKDRGHGDLADKLSGVNPEKIGDFLGSAAGGDFDQAFKIAGSSAANYLHDKFKEKLDEKLGEWIEPNSPAATIGKYVPWNTETGKQIAIQALRGNYAEAGNLLTTMVMDEGRKNLETLSKDIIAGSIDWVLKPTVGPGAGNLFLTAVKLEMAGIEWFKRWSQDYLTEDRRNQYNRLRLQGLTPEQAMNTIMDDSLQLAFARYPFNGNLENALEYLEVQYARSRNITPATLKHQREAEANKILKDLGEKLRKQQEEYNKKLKQELLQIFLAAAKNHQELKKLITSLKSARDKIDAIKAETAKLEGFWKKNKRVFDPDKMEEKKRAIDEKLTEFEEGIKGSGLEKCSQIDGWQTTVDSQIEAIDTLLKEIRELGLKSKEIVQKICDNKEDKTLVKQGMIALKKRIGYADSKSRQIPTHKTKALATLKKLETLKTDVKALLDKQRSVDSTLNQIDRWNDLLKAARKNVDTPADNVKQLHADIRKIIDNPIFNRFKGKKNSIRYTILGDAQEAVEDFDTQKSEVEAGLKKLADSLKGFDGVKDRLEIHKQNLDKALGDCRKLQDLDLSQYRERLQKLDEKDKRYKSAFETLKHKAKTCAGDEDDSLDSAALDQARRLLDKARERGGVVIDNFVIADNTKNRLAGILAAASGALARVSSPAANYNELLTACTQAQGQSKQLESEIQAATAASAGHLANLKKGYEDATNARKNACEEATAAGSASDPEQCRERAAQAQAQASTAIEAAQMSIDAAGKMKSLYDSLKSKSGLKSFDELLRKIPAAIQALKDQITAANGQLEEIDADEIGRIMEQAQNAKAKASSAAQKVFGLVGQIRGLLAGIGADLAVEANHLAGEAESVNEIAARRERQTTEAAAQAKLAGEKAIATIKDAKAKIDALASAVDGLSQCRNTDLGGDLNEMRTNSDMGEIFGPAAKADAENARQCAQQAAQKCQDLKTPCDPNEKRNKAGNCVCKDGFKRGTDGKCKKPGCQDDTDCDLGLVCVNGDCVEPFDKQHEISQTLLGQKGEDHNRQEAQQTAIDQSTQSTRNGYTSDDMDDEQDETQTFVSTECNDRKPCPPGHTCENNKCVKKHADCKSDADCAKGEQCEDGHCVQKARSQPKGLVISPANKAVKLNESVSFKANLQMDDGTTKDVTGEATWSPGNPFSQGTIGQYTVRATYQGVSGTAMVTVVKEKGMDDITVNSKTITVTFFDHGDEDGDRIDILINGKAVFPGITLTKAPQSRSITMDADIIVFGFRALNVGTKPPNTATVIFSSVVKGKNRQEYRLSKNQKTNMNITYAP